MGVLFCLSLSLSVSLSSGHTHFHPPYCSNWDNVAPRPFRSRCDLRQQATMKKEASNKEKLLVETHQSLDALGCIRFSWSTSNQNAMEGFISKDSWWTHASHDEEPQPRQRFAKDSGWARGWGLKILDLVMPWPNPDLRVGIKSKLLALFAFCPSMLFQASL